MFFHVAGQYLNANGAATFEDDGLLPKRYATPSLGVAS